MNCHNIILNYIQNCEKNEPIFIEDIKEYIMQFYKEEEKEKIFNNVKEILNRLNKENIIKTAYKGIYYIPKTNIFGEVPLANSKIIQYKYLVDKFGNIKGYVTGANLFNKVGLTTQVPNIIDIVTNECKNNNKYVNKYLNVIVRKPKIEINNENYKYLQLIDLIENKDNIYVEVENMDEIIYNFIQENELDFEKILKYARETNSKAVIKKNGYTCKIGEYMKLHLNKELFRDMIDTLNTKTGIAIDIIEKDYYVCLILEELSKRQNEIKAYFKGGTAVYKILENMNRFSEDIDLTVKVLPEESNTRNKKRLKESALGYKLDGLELIKEECIDNKGSVTGMYKYNSVYSDSEIALQRAGKIQVESTSFTVSEPIEKYYIEPLIYKLASDDEKKILEEKFDISKIEIEIIKLERMFIDKLFAAEFYYTRNMYMDVSKHLYDISILFNNDKIKKLLESKEELSNLIEYKRQEEKVRIGGIDENIQIKDFNYFKLEFSKELIKEFENMQNKYVLNDKYKVNIDEVKNILKQIYNII